MLLALTGYGSAQDRRDALASGFDYHLLKPANPATLLNLIDASMQSLHATGGGAPQRTHFGP